MNEPDEKLDSLSATPPDATQSLATNRFVDEATDATRQRKSRTTEQPATKANVQGIGRYRVENILGEGGFGIVYLAHDDDLQRRVAIKVPQARRIRSPGDADAYLIEAQILARLDHPHIVPVFDMGRSADGLPFVVSKFIEGSNLQQRINVARPSIRESVMLVARMAEALQYAHQHRLVHRDVKPANILLDENNRPFLVDFGVALREEDFGKEGNLSGTPAYMSPEQACGEGHLVDGRSDIYSLGVVLYELLTGQRPFDSPSVSQLLMLIMAAEPRPPRQSDPAIPKELERITLKALAKRASERYSTALDFADDLEHWLKPEGAVEKGPASHKIIPKGLRSFGAEDSDFFLELLPGPRDREGLPETLRFWKNRIEEPDAEHTFRVGVIYGPSGCGKSSFVKAGLLPRLANTVRVVYVEATPHETELRLLRGLEKACPELHKNLPLREAITHLRRDERARKKVVLVVDQFEQWLHGQHNQENAELVQALRQCDGERVQCIVMVRDDFWLTVSRFMKNLEIRIVEGHNAALVDLFDLRHAQKVLTAFGTAYGTLPDSGELTKDQETFLTQAVTGLAQEGKVISVRLALFAEMVKGKAWTPATLKEIGGTEGVGVTFLEEKFTASTAPPQHRVHQQAARAVLNALLPEHGTDIKGQMRSHADLLKASGYAGRPQEFEDLLAILNSEVRLITPTDPAGADAESEIMPVGQYYQLTHDYLVPSLRDWLTRKQKETRRGQAELLLADRAAVWNARPENRQLPSPLQWLQIQWLTARKNWTPPQQKMMRQAGRVHGIRSALAVLLLLAFVVSAMAVRNRVVADRADALVEALLVAPPQAVPYAVENLTSVRSHALPILRQRVAEESRIAAQRLHASLALAQFGAVDVPFLVSSIGNAPSGECANIVTALRRDPAAACSRLMTQFASEYEPNSRLRLAVVALHLGETKPAQQMLALAADPSQRTLLIHELHKWRDNVADYAALLRTTDDPDFQSGLIQALGRIPESELSVEARAALEPVLCNLYLTCRHAPTHSAARWTLQQWKVNLPKISATKSPTPEQRWYVNPLGMTFVQIPKGTFLRKDVDGNELGNVSLSRAYWLGDCEVTWQQFEEFIADPDCASEEKPKDWRVLDQCADCPVSSVSWFDAVLFCNWLSRREGLRPCYERTGAKQKYANKELDVWRSMPNATGYRLPTEAEWEYACRAKSGTLYCYGNDEAMLSQYAAYNTRYAHPVARRQPNGWGLFDMHGSVWEYTQDWRSNLDKTSEDPTGPATGEHRVNRGGSFYSGALVARSAYRGYSPPADRLYTSGFRVARTYP